MESGSSGRANSGSKGFGFASDDILCSFSDYGHSYPGMGTNSSMDFHKSGLARPVCAPPAYSQPEDSLIQDMVDIVDKSMKKYADNLMRFLEGISSRLSQLELYCYNLDKSIREMQSEMNGDHGDADTKLKSIEKHLQEVQRSVHILRDKQEIADAQKELAKLQLAQEESSSSNSLSGDERASTSVTETKKTDNTSDTSNLQLALALPHQVAPPQSVQAFSQAIPQNVSPQQAYYLSPAQIPNPSVASQLPQIHYVPSEPQGRSAQSQEIYRVPPQSTQPQVMHPFPQYQQQWSQQLPQQVPVQPSSQQQSSVPPQMRAPPLPIYSTYPQSQNANPSMPPPPQEPLPNSKPKQMPYSGVPPPVSSRTETLPYGYAGPSRIIQQQPPPESVKGAVGPQPGDGYAADPQTPVPPGSGYMVHEADGGRSFCHQPPERVHFSQGMYHPPNVPHPNPQANPPNNFMVQNSSHPQFVQNHHYG